MVVLGPLAGLPPEPAGGREDTFWLDVVGIPFDVWCAMGSCTGQLGYVFPEGMVAYLAARRDAGDFREPVSLAKRHRRIKPYRFIAPVGGEPIEIETVRRRRDEEMVAALSVPDSLLEGSWRGREYEQRQFEREQFAARYRPQCPFCGTNQVVFLGGPTSSTACICQCCGRNFGVDSLILGRVEKPPPNPALFSRR